MILTLASHTLLRTLFLRHSIVVDRAKSSTLLKTSAYPD